MTTNGDISTGEWVAIQRENFIKVHKVVSGAVAMLGRDCVELGHLLGQPKWSTYSLEEIGKKAHRKFSLKLCDSDMFDEKFEDLIDETVDGKDNRFIRDDGQSQKLSKEEIEGLQSDGASAKEIIGQLVTNSSTFEQKTAYAQEKYVNKKQKKYKRTVLVRPTSIRLILQALVGPSGDTSKVVGLRIDSLAQLVYMSGAQSGAGPATFLIFESGTQGLVTAAMIERIGDDSEAHLIVLGPVRGTNKAISIQAMNFPQSVLERVHHVSLSAFLDKSNIEGLMNKSNDETKVDNDVSEAVLANEGNVEELDVPMDQVNVESTEGNGISNVRIGRKRTHESDEVLADVKRMLTNEEKEVNFCIERLKQSRADCLLIVGKENPSDLLEALLPLVELSRPVVLFSQFREPLQEAYMKLKIMKCVNAIRLTEPWLRKYQVLTERTHPEVTMSGSGGYVLTGLTVDPN